MVGEMNLNVLLSTMTGTLVDGIFVFATSKNGFPLKGIKPTMIFEEAEGTTCILRKEEADTAQIPYEFPCRMITLEVHSSLEAVGFIARIATELAKEGMGVNSVAGFFHDHIFIADGREEDALRVLGKIAAAAKVEN